MVGFGGEFKEKLEKFLISAHIEGLYISTVEKVKYRSGLIKSHVEFFLQEVESTQPSQ